LLALGSVGQMLVRMVGRMELAACVWEGEGLFKATGVGLRSYIQTSEKLRNFVIL
jgi:hypothetical protein